MLMTEVFAFAAGGIFMIFSIYILLKKNPSKHSHLWLLPAIASFLFLVFSALAIIEEGLFGFWVEHSSRSLWGNQIWFDLLLMASIAWYLVLPQARKLGMSLPFWLLLIISTGSIGFLAMLARLLFLQNRANQSLLK